MSCRSSRRRKGVAAVEAALILPLFFLLAYGALETCSAVFTWQSVTVAAYEGARVATQTFAYNDQVKEHCKNLLEARHVVDFEIVITSEGVEVDDLSTIPPGEPVSVSVSAPGSKNAILLIPIFHQTDIQHQVTMIKE